MSEGRDINEDWRRAQLEASARREAEEAAERERRYRESAALSQSLMNRIQRRDVSLVLDRLTL